MLLPCLLAYRTECVRFFWLNRLRTEAGLFMTCLIIDSALIGNRIIGLHNLLEVFTNLPAWYEIPEQIVENRKALEAVIQIGEAEQTAVGVDVRSKPSSLW